MFCLDYVLYAEFIEAEVVELPSTREAEILHF